jgi:chemotaxis protein CheD
MEKVRVGIADYRLAEEPEALVAYGLGSCLAVAIYDPRSRRGGLAHALLPEPLPMVGAAQSASYVDTAINEMVTEIEKRGSNRADLIAKLVGASQMFETIGSTIEAIGVRNLRKAGEVLDQLGIPVAAEETGGNQGRSLEFNLTNGEVQVYKVRQVEPTII